jgi:pimeloyl-ACP methyl ester carboxylesterase
MGATTPGRGAPLELVLLPAALCDEALYEETIARLTDVVRARTMVVAGPDPAGARARAERVARGEFAGVVEDLAAAIASPRGPAALATARAFREMAARIGAERFLRQQAALVGRRDRRDELGRIACPALIVHGADDAFVDRADADLLAARVPRARLVTLDACGHLPTLEYPDEVARVARQWLRECFGPGEAGARRGAG